MVLGPLPCDTGPTTLLDYAWPVRLAPPVPEEREREAQELCTRVTQGDVVGWAEIGYWVYFRLPRWAAKINSLLLTARIGRRKLMHYSHRLEWAVEK
jgi:hypothetical protein